MTDSTSSTPSERLIGPDDFGLPSRIDVYVCGIDEKGEEYGSRYERRFDDEMLERAAKVLRDEEQAYRRGDNALPTDQLAARVLRAALHPEGKGHLPTGRGLGEELPPFDADHQVYVPPADRNPGATSR
jgi:hypothetical protein